MMVNHNDRLCCIHRKLNARWHIQKCLEHRFKIKKLQKCTYFMTQTFKISTFLHIEKKNGRMYTNDVNVLSLDWGKGRIMGDINFVICNSTLKLSTEACNSNIVFESCKSDI